MWSRWEYIFSLRDFPQMSEDGRNFLVILESILVIFVIVSLILDPEYKILQIFFYNFDQIH